MDTITDIEQDLLGSRSLILVMRDLADCATLLFLAVVDVQPHPRTQQPISK